MTDATSTKTKLSYELEYWDENRYQEHSEPYDTLEEAEDAFASARDHRLATEFWTRLMLVAYEDHYEGDEIAFCAPLGVIENYDLYEDSGDYVVNLNGGYVDFEQAMNLADEELCEELHEKMAPCSKQEFFRAYGHAHYERFGEYFAPFFGGAW